MKTKLKEYAGTFTHRKLLLAVADAFILVAASLIANFLLSLFGCGIPVSDLIVPIVIGTICCFAFLFIWGAYSKMWRYFNAKDYLSCVFGVVLGFGASSAVAVLTHNVFPPSLAIIDAVISTFGICAFRLIFKRAFIALTNDGRTEALFKRTMLIGAGQACRTLLDEIMNAKNSPYEDDKTASLFDPICIIDDDTKKIGTSIHGVQVVGKTNDIAKYAKELEIEQILFCIPSCIEDERRRILDLCTETDLPVKIIPFIGTLMLNDEEGSLLTQVRNINFEDLLGRDPIKFDNKDIRTFIQGKVCMVTGGGGSIGSELVRQIAKYDPKQVIIVDICENYAYDIQQELIMEYGDKLNLVVRIASVRDYYRMNQLLEIYKPQIVFHAAAHKHVPLMEDSPMEAIKNNCIGTFYTATLAQFHEGRNVAFVLLIVAVGNVSLGVVESAAPARIGIFLADFYQTFP